jgi:glutamine---fructose-6-phosphate transaminase (isomerizing)
MAEIAGQPDAVRRAASGLTDQRSTLDRLAGEAVGRTLIFTGMGSSYDACYPAITQLAAAGIAAVHVDSSELLHFRRNLLGPSALLVAVSQSGESAEVVKVVEEAGGHGSTVLCITNGTTNTLTRGSDLTLDTRVGQEIGPSTMTFGAALVLVAAAGRVLAGVDPHTVEREIHGGAEAAAAAIEHLLEQTSLPDELATWFDGRPHSVILGRGSARAAAEMGALTLKEAVGLPIESLETAQFRHGPLELAGPDLAAIIIATEPETRGLDVGLAGELVQAGAGVLVVVEDGEGPSGATCIELGRLDRGLAPAVSIVPAQLLAWKLAVLSGRPPGSYVRASKVTIRE